MIELDHVILVVTDLDAAAERLLGEHGLASVPGGRHAGHGTGNRIVPLGDTYIELMAVMDADEAAGSPMGRWALEAATDRLQPTSLCLRTDDIGPVAEYLGEQPEPMSRVKPDGATLSWELAGLKGMLGPDRLPFFIRWHGDRADHPGRMVAAHRVEGTRLVRVAAGDPGPLADLATNVVGLDRVEGLGVQSIEVATGAGPIRLP